MKYAARRCLPWQLLGIRPYLHKSTFKIIR